MQENNKFEQKVNSLSESRPKEHHEKKIKKHRYHVKEWRKKDYRERRKPKEINESEHREVKTHSGGMDIKEASEMALKKLSEATGKKAESTVSISEQGENWQAIIEIIDEEFLPGQNLKSMSDIMGVYDVTLDRNGKLIKWTKKSSRKRGNVSV